MENMSTSHFVNSHFVNVDNVGIDKVGINQLLYHISTVSHNNSACMVEYPPTEAANHRPYISQ